MPAFALTALAWVKAGFSSIAGLFTKYPWQASCACLVALSAWLWHGKASLSDKLAATKATIANVKTEQKQATKDQVAVNHAPAAASKAIAEESDEKRPEYYADVHKAGLAYAAAHPVRLQCKAAGSTVSGADLPGAAGPAEVDDGSGLAPSMVAVFQADFDLLTANSGRLASARRHPAAD